MKICAVIVTYFPQKEMFAKAVNALYPQVDNIVVVNNTDGYEKDFGSDYAHGVMKKIKIIFSGKNQGVAAGHNKGIAWARKNGFSHVLLMDQDSIAQKNMVEKLFSAWKKLRAEGEKVAAVGPSVIDVWSGLPLPFIRDHKGVVRRISCMNDSEYIKVLHLISSATLIHMPVLDVIGDMEEELFIDSVDIEWGLRAMHKGFDCYGVCAARLYHKIGNKRVGSSILGNRRLLLHESVRYYYQYRNAFALYRRQYIPFNWVVYDFVLQRCVRLVFFLLAAPQPIRNVKMMFKGIWHAIVGIKRPYHE